MCHYCRRHHHRCCCCNPLPPPTHLLPSFPCCTPSYNVQPSSSSHISGERKLDVNRNAIEGSGDFQIEFLKRFALWISEWQKSKLEGRSNETFLAVRQTSEASVLLAEYCLKELGFYYVLLAKFQSDPLEGRFGWYRQLNGGNHYLSCRQLCCLRTKERFELCRC